LGNTTDKRLAYGIDVRKSNTTITNQMTKGKKYYHHYSQNMPALQRAKQANFKILRQLSDGIDI
jgi:hypothetical protein